MSVVNKMLRDLDNREKIKNFAPVSANYVPPKSSKGLWFGVVCFGLFSGMVASYSIYLSSQSPTSGPIKQIPVTNAIQKGDQYASQIDIVRNQNPQKDSAKSSQSDLEISAYSPRTMVKTNQLLASSTISSVNNHNATLNVLKSEALPASQTSFSVAASDGAKSELSSLRAEAHMASKRKDEAKVVQLLQEILVIAPQEIKTRKQLAALLFSKNQLNEAKVVLTQGVLLAPADSSLRLMLSRIFFRLGDLNQAFKILDEHPYGAIANDELVSFRAALAEKTGHYNLAQQDYLLLVRRHPNDAKWWLGLGVSLDKQKLSDEAINSYQQAQSLNQLSEKVDTFVAQRIQLLAERS